MVIGYESMMGPERISLFPSKYFLILVYSLGLAGVVRGILSLIIALDLSNLVVIRCHTPRPLLCARVQLIRHCLRFLIPSRTLLIPFHLRQVVGFHL